jgi:hypothetical protein
MRTGSRLLSSLAVLAVLAAFSTTTFTKMHTSATPKVRVTTPVDNSKRTTIFGHVTVAVKKANDLGHVDPSTPVQHVIMVLKSDGDQTADCARATVS